MSGKWRLAGRLVLCGVGVFVAGVPPASAQDGAVIRGQVVSEDRTAIAEAAIAIVRREDARARRDVADAAGRFAFQDLPPGEYVVTAFAEGFAPRELQVVLEPREVRSLSLVLGIGPIAVSVEVAAGNPLPGTHSPSSTVLTHERLEQVAPMQRQNLPDAIVSLAPGMIRGHDDFVHIRGHEVALNPLIHGVSFWENPHTLFSGGLASDVIETANVMTGGFSAEYGNRFGGVVDIVTKSGYGMREHGTLTATAGGAARRSLSGEIGGSREGFGYYVFGSGFESDRFLSPPDAAALHDSGRAGRAFARIDAGRGDTGAFRVLFMADGSNFEIPVTPADATLRPQALPEQRTRQQSAIAGWSRAASNAVWSATAYQRWSRSRLLPAAGPLTARAEVTRELLTVGAKADMMHVSGRHAWKAGVDAVRLRPVEALSYEYEGYRELTHLLGLPHIHLEEDPIELRQRASGGQLSAHVQDSIQLGSRVTADLGVRVDRYDLVIEATHASPRVNVAVQAGRGSVLHVSYNRFFVPPPVEGVLSNAAGLTGLIREIGSVLPPPEATVEDQGELGVTAPVGDVLVGVTGYYRLSDNPVHTTVWPDSRIYSYASFDRARAYGLEVRLEAPGLRRYGVSAYANYALGRVYFYNPVTAGFVTESAHLADASRFPGPMDQTHTATGGAVYDHTRTGLWLGASIEYGSGTPVGHGDASHDHADGADHAHAPSSDGGARVPSHVTGSVSAGIGLLRDAGRRARLTLRLDVENVTNTPYRIAQESQFSPGQFSAPRLVSLTARVRF